MDNFDEVVENKKDFMVQEEEKDSLSFNDIIDKTTNCKELHLLMVFERVLCEDMPNSALVSAEHDVVFYLYPEVLNKFLYKASESDLKEIIACGVFYDDEHDSLTSFV